MIKHKMRFSIWMTTLAVIVLILLMALTVNRAREKDIINQFSLQQLAVARGTAARLETLFGNIEKSLIILSQRPSVRIMQPEETVSSMKVIFDHLGGQVRFIARLDDRGSLLTVYSDRPLDGLQGENFAGHAFFRQIRDQKAPFIGELGLSDAPWAEHLGMKRVIVIGVSTYRYGTNDRC